MKKWRRLASRNIQIALPLADKLQISKLQLSSCVRGRQADDKVNVLCPVHTRQMSQLNMTQTYFQCLAGRPKAGSMSLELPKRCARRAGRWRLQFSQPHVTKAAFADLSAADRPMAKSLFSSSI